MTEKKPEKNSVSRKPRASKTSTRTTKTSQRTSKTSTRTNKTGGRTSKTDAHPAQTEGQTVEASEQAAKTEVHTTETSSQAAETDSKPVEKKPQPPAEDDIPIAEIIPEIDLDSAALDEFLAEPPQEQQVAASDEPNPIIYDTKITDFPPLPPWPILILTIVVIALLL